MPPVFGQGPVASRRRPPRASRPGNRIANLSRSRTAGPLGDHSGACGAAAALERALPRLVARGERRRQRLRLGGRHRHDPVHHRGARVRRVRHPRRGDERCGHDRYARPARRRRRPGGRVHVRPRGRAHRLPHDEVGPPGLDLAGDRRRHRRLEPLQRLGHGRLDVRNHRGDVGGVSGARGAHRGPALRRDPVAPRPGEPAPAAGGRAYPVRAALRGGVRGVQPGSEQHCERDGGVRRVGPLRSAHPARRLRAHPRAAALPARRNRNCGRRFHLLQAGDAHGRERHRADVAARRLGGRDRAFRRAVRIRLPGSRAPARGARVTDHSASCRSRARRPSSAPSSDSA